MSDQNLFTEFEAVSAKAWKQKIQVDLKGADYNDTLIWESPEGIHIKPFYHSDDLEGKFLVPPKASKKWSIVQFLNARDANKTNLKAREALDKGAEGLFLTIADSKIDPSALLAHIDLETVPIYFQFQFLALDYLKSVIDLANEKEVKFHLNIDIIGNLARTGNWFHNMDKDHKILKETLRYSQNFTGVSVAGVGMDLYQNAGGNSVQQLAYGLAHAHEYLNWARDEENLPICFHITVGGNYFMEIAKIRAFQLLWKTLSSEYSHAGEGHILTQPSKRNKTLYDYNVNMLRTTTECMSAILGGADAVCNLPYDALFHHENPFGERISRNQLLILKRESYFEKVANPADGSYYIEELTRQLAEKALALFKSIEKGGGFLKQLKNHTLQKKIKESAQREQQRFSEGQEVLVGTNKYRNAEDRMQGQLDRSPFRKMQKRKTLLEPILERRLAADVEQKRLRDE
ncbi:MAG: methylmalonyl-CoA mutase subunit beta [Bacteroidota bacterium]